METEGPGRLWSQAAEAARLSLLRLEWLAQSFGCSGDCARNAISVTRPGRSSSMGLPRRPGLADMWPPDQSIEGLDSDRIQQRWREPLSRRVPRRLLPTRHGSTTTECWIRGRWAGQTDASGPGWELCHDQPGADALPSKLIQQDLKAETTGRLGDMGCLPTPGRYLTGCGTNAGRRVSVFLGCPSANALPNIGWAEWGSATFPAVEGTPPCRQRSPYAAHQLYPSRNSGRVCFGWAPRTSRCPRCGGRDQ